MLRSRTKSQVEVSAAAAAASAGAPRGSPEPQCAVGTDGDTGETAADAVRAAGKQQQAAWGRMNTPKSVA